MTILIYNIRMNIQEFKDSEIDFIEEFKNSSLYKRNKELSNLISLNDELNKLAEERDNLYYLASSEEDEEKKREYLVKAKENNDKINDNELVKEYLQTYNELKKILNIINEGILKDLKKW